MNSQLIDGSVKETFPLFLHSFCDSLSRVISRIDRFRPIFTKAIICWDGYNSGNVRRKIFPPYKINRRTEVDSVSLPFEMIDLLRQELGKVSPRFNICHPDAEGDDLMALFCEILDNDEIMLVTRDKDMYQLVNSKVKVFNLFTNELIGPNEVEEYFGVPPEGVVEIKSIIGDSSDNYKGLHGIGPKKGLKLYKEGNTVKKFPELDVYRKLAKIPFYALDTNEILENMLKVDLDSPPNWEAIIRKFGISDYVASKLYVVV